ncbi:MAG: hypothetical protein Kow0077_00640 [Anaerolineae bacterium]
MKRITSRLSARLRRRVRLALRLFLLCVAISVLFRGSAPPPGDLYTVAASYARDRLFNYVGWEAQALSHKLGESLWGISAYLPENARSAYVRAYMADLARLQSLEAEIAAIFSDPAIPDPATASAELRTRRDALRDDLAERQGMAEAILEQQVSVVLAEEGLAFLGQVLPPVAIHMTPLPDVLIISPRDEIRVSASLSLNDTPPDERNALEAAIDADLDVASLVVDIGGMALYPSMVMESSHLPWVLETTAHEWVHHYLFFFPLGLNYFDDSNPETRAINETTAEIIGKEIGRAVLARYYPDLVPPDPSPAPPAPPAPDESGFDFAAEMHRTRVTVDALLADGRVEDAETYMAERRAFFHANGYPIRKLNQAYFAFYGGYQGDTNFGTAGEDPIGPALVELRARSNSVAEFLATVRGITTREALLALVASSP